MAEEHSEFCIDLTEDSDGEIPKNESQTDELILLDSDVTTDDDKDVKIVNKKVKRSQTPRKGKVKKNRIQFIDDQSPEYFEQQLERAVLDIRKGGSRGIVSNRYGIPEEVIIEKLCSKPRTDVSKILTNTEEKNLVKWIISSKRNNTIILRRQLLDKVASYKKVSKISLVFSNALIGFKWFNHFLSSHPEICDNDGLLMPAEDVEYDEESESSAEEWGPSTSHAAYVKPPREAFSHRLRGLKQEPTDVFASLGIKKAVVVLHDFRKQEDPPFILDEKGNVTFKSIKDEPGCSGVQWKVTADTEYSAESKDIMEVDKTEIIHAMLNESDSEIENEPKEVCHLKLNESDSEIEIEQKEVCHIKLNENDSDLEVDDKSGVCHPQLNEGESDIENDKQEIETYHIQLHESDSDIDMENGDVKVSENVDQSTIGRDISNLPDSTNNKRKKYRKRERNGNSGTLTCEICDKTFCNAYKLKRHSYIHIPSDQYSFPCKKCSKKFASKYHFQLHLKYTHTRGYFKCNDCEDKVFKHRTSLRNHQRQHHSHLVGSCTVADSNFVCDTCGNQFTYKNSLETHIRFVHMAEEKPYPCNICKKRFIKRSAMQRHKWKHSKVKQFICSFCARSFSRNYLLREHIQLSHKSEEEDTEDECTKLSKEYLSCLKVE